MEKQITWTIAAISEFAKAKALSVKQAFNYLSLFKGKRTTGLSICFLLKIPLKI